MPTTFAAVNIGGWDVYDRRLGCTFRFFVRGSGYQRSERTVILARWFPCMAEVWSRRRATPRALADCSLTLSESLVFISAFCPTKWMYGGSEPIAPNLIENTDEAAGDTDEPMLVRGFAQPAAATYRFGTMTQGTFSDVTMRGFS